MEKWCIPPFFSWKSGKKTTGMKKGCSEKEVPVRRRRVCPDGNGLPDVKTAVRQGAIALCRGCKNNGSFQKTKIRKGRTLK